MPRPAIRAPVDGKCSVCGSNDFGTRNRCKQCRRVAQRADWAANLADVREKCRVRMKEWRRANPDKVCAQDRRRRYNVTTSEFEAMLAEQGNRCAICGDRAPNCLDHCHESGRFRGVLCRKCNAGLGQFQDTPELLRAAARYLERKREK